MKIKFTKMQAYGNDYIYIFTEPYEIEDYSLLAQKISDRHFGVGSDGMVLISSSDTCDFRMRIFNPDGTEAEMCGNALRSTAMFVYYHALTKKDIVTIETLGGNKIVYLSIFNNQVVNIHAMIGRPEPPAKQIPQNAVCFVIDRAFELFSLSWGNPHTVVFVDDVEEFDVEKYGKAIEYLECFPERTNVTFAQLIDKSNIKIREWERGTGETLGCGTGCCSAVVIAHRLGKCDRSVRVEQPGGTLDVLWDDDGNVHMIGPSHVVCEGEYSYDIK